MHNVMIVIISTFTIAITLNLLLKRYGIPTIIGYIFTGLIVSKVFGLHSGSNDTLTHIAEFGIVFLMFTIGLEFSIAHLKSMKEEVFVNGALQVSLSALLFFVLIVILLGIDLKSAIIIAAAISLSSTAIVLKVLNESGQINSEFGKKALGMLLFQDIAVIPILLMVDIFANTEQSLGVLLFYTLIEAIVALSILFVFGKYIVERFLELSYTSNEIYIASILLIVIGSAYLAHLFGFSYSLGAFIAGMTIAETKYKHQIEADLIPFRDLLLGLFFITIGMQIDIAVIAKNIVIIVALLFFIMLIKASMIYAILVRKTTKRTAFKSALSLCQIGEFSLVVLALANTTSLVDNHTVQILLATVVLSMIATPFILKNLSVFADRIVPEPIPQTPITCESFINHVIVCGYANAGKSVVRKLIEKNIPYIIIEHDLKLVEQAKRAKRNIILGNATQISLLEKLNIHKASAVIVAIDNFQKLHLVIDTITSISKEIDIIVKVANKQEQELLQEYNLKHVLDRADIMAQIIVDEALSCKISDKKER
ncbi:MAG: hypothetical protein KU38_11840 [Sulfurovum sp. FS08-3]|nr:MAG: hypothetical protein KU38_11840 [Sulfurovum sp. FS08-3]